MSAMWERLERGERRWAAELGLRALGLALLLAAAVLLLALCRLVQRGPAHPATPLEFAVAAPLWGSLAAGIALSIEGAGLFRRPPPPRKPL